ncbi:MAG: hypothetical protein DRH89_03820 [Candidatus Cloacimonadota bacterium]|nr:MAG: hypothetical protein DRH89_03820 [Candidatus Cloacimonadota bacterium]
MKFFDKIQNIDRRYIYIVVALSIIIPLLIPFNSPTYVTKPTEDIYKKIDSFAGDETKAILMSFTHDASTMPELFPMEVSVLRHCFERNIKVFTICWLPAAAPLVDYALNTAREDFDVQSGVDYCNFGYKPYVLRLPIMLGMGDDIAKAVETDSQGRKVENLEIMKNIKNYDDMNLVVDFAASGSALQWITYARARFGANIAAGVTAVMVADNYPYLQTGQLMGMFRGLKGAAEYEKLVDVFAANDRPFSKEIIKETSIAITGDTVPYKYKKARIGMNAQSVAHIMMIVFILLGNIGYFITRKKEL